MLKIGMTIAASLLVFSSFAQSSEDSPITPGRTDIVTADHEIIGKLMTIPGLHSYLFIESCSQAKDSTGEYVTIFKFGNPNRIVAYKITIILQFNRHVESVDFTTNGAAKNLKTTEGSNKLGVSYQASELAANGTVIATIRSKDKVSTFVTGIEGQLHP